MTEPSHAVFLSYASEDAEAAQKICAALRSAGVEVWFDQSELRGGDAWDRHIRERIHDCRLFMALISAHTEARDEGYFRHEWKLAVERTHHMSDKKPFLVPIVIDDTRERGASVPDRLREVQWTHLPGGKTPPEFVERVRRLVSPEPHNAQPATPLAAGAAPAPLQAMRVPASWQSTWALRAIAAALVASAVVYFAIDRFSISKHPPLQPTAPAAQASASPTAFSPPPHSVAVLPFVNMSGDKEQEYFSDGLSEELLNSLARVEQLQVAARTSAFAFKGRDTDVGTIAHKLNVASVLEGSVRRSHNTVRITAELINTGTGFHLWSQSYDRSLGDMLEMQSEIASAVASALKITLLGDTAAKLEIGGTRIPAAFDDYLRGSRAYGTSHNAHDYQVAIASYSEAIRLDPNYAQAVAARSVTLSQYAGEFGKGPALREGFANALADARRAIALSPELAEGHLALAFFFTRGSLDFARASEEYAKAVALAPGNARVLQEYGRFSVWMGRDDAGITAARHAVVLDPLNPRSYSRLGDALFFAHRYQEAVKAYDGSIAVDPDFSYSYGTRGLAYYALGDFQHARLACELKPVHWVNQVCLAVTYDKLGRHPDAEAALAKLRASLGDAQAYQYAEIYAQWGNTAKALDWLDTAVRLNDGGLAYLKTDPLLDPLRKEPRFQAIRRELRFPE